MAGGSGLKEPIASIVADVQAPTPVVISSPLKMDLIAQIEVATK